MKVERRGWMRGEVTTNAVKINEGKNNQYNFSDNVKVTVHIPKNTRNIQHKINRIYDILNPKKV